jgi:hypothetical protein
MEFHRKCPVTEGDADATRLASTCTQLRHIVIYCMNRVWYKRVANLTKKPKDLYHSVPNWWNRRHCLMDPVSEVWRDEGFWMAVLESVRREPEGSKKEGFTGTRQKVETLCSDRLHWKVRSYRLEPYLPKVCYHRKLVDMALRHMGVALVSKKQRLIESLHHKFELGRSKIASKQYEAEQICRDIIRAKEQLKRGMAIMDMVEKRRKRRRV